MVATQPTVFRPLRDARYKVGLALSLVIGGLEQGQQDQDKINKARSAIEDWIMELKSNPTEDDRLESKARPGPH
jgi:hypothetical protein